MIKKRVLKNSILLVITFLFACVFSFSQTEKGTVNIDISPDVKELIQKKIAYNRSNPKVDGYRIQLFYGSEGGALRVRNKFLALFPNTPTSIDWDSPEWKVRVGKYKTRLEADKAIEEIKMTFGNAIVVNMKIRI